MSRLARFGPLLFLLYLGACQRAPSPEGQASSQAFLQCAKDTDCKGDRICEFGKCTNPPPRMQQVLPPATASTVVPAVATAVAPEAPTLKKIFVSKNLQSNLEYFESITGPARETLGNERTYDVDGCEVIGITSGKLVSAIGIKIKKGCDFDLNTFLPNFGGKFPPMSKLTMRKFQDIVGRGVEYYVPCFDCGTSMDPITYAVWTGSHADQVLEVRLETEAVPETVRIAIQSESFDFNFNCKPNKYESLARKDPPKGLIKSIVVGYDIPTEKCG